MAKFRRHIGIDYSGAQTPTASLKGLRVYLAERRHAVPVEVLPPPSPRIAKTRTTGGAAPRVNMSTVRAYPIPLAPLAEQRRIVAKVDELMALCDRLEASLTTAADTRRRLLDAILAEALTPDDERELEAAE
jgi:type I restriction enzyme S subunit